MKFRKTFKNFLFLILLCTIILFACSKKTDYSDYTIKHQESILDKKVHIEDKLITKIPDVERWCNQIKFKKHRINVGDAELYVEEHGKGIPLVLINGGPGGTHHYFHPWFSRAKNYARVIYYDQRGCGLSDFEPGEKGYSVKQAVNDLNKLRKALKIDKWVLLGYSYGGFLAQLYTTTHPEKVKGLILIGSSPGIDADFGPSRQNEFITNKEQKRLKKIRVQLLKYSLNNNLSREKYIQLLIYNNFLNGDWKRQHFYKPSIERLAEIARYEWVQDKGFNTTMSNSMNNVDLTGAFKNNPIPTLILEGKWDLTWNRKKPKLLKQNHPNAKMIIFEKAGHGIYSECPDKFFSILKDFIENLPKIPSKKIARFKKSLKIWRKKDKHSISITNKYDWGWFSSKKLVKEYKDSWLNKHKNGPISLLRIGFAFYDLKNYSKAFQVFEFMENASKNINQEPYEAVALIWQGHMLDLDNKHKQAKNKYKKVLEMNINDTWTHSQYRLKYSLSSYAKKRIKEPYKFIPNYSTD